MDTCLQHNGILNIINSAIEGIKSDYSILKSDAEYIVQEIKRAIL